MAITQNFNGVTLRVPGAYSSLKTNLIGNLPLSEIGIVGIIGEAAKGEPGSSGGIAEYDSSTLSNLVDQYGSGPLVDAARMLVNASNDARIPNGAGRILVYKTNASTQADLDIVQGGATAYGTITSANWGVEENLISATIEQDTAEAFTLQFGADWTTTPASDLTLRVNGGAIVTLTAANCTSAAATVTEINSKLNTALGTVGIAYASTATNRISINLAITGTGAKRNGMGISLEFIASGEYVDIGVTVGQQGSAIVAGSGVTGLTAANPTRTITIARQSDGIEETTDDTTGELGGDIYLEIGCNAATTATLSITATALTTAVAGSGASALNLTLANYNTLNDLAEYINAQTGYQASIPDGINGGLPPSVLDRVSGVGICASVTDLKPGQVKADAYEIQNWFDTNSALTSFERTNYLGLPDTLAQTFLSGGTRGASTSSTFDAGFTAFEAERVNIIIPLVSQDASDDIAEDADYTDSSSTYDVESIHTQARAHCRKMSNTQNRSERNCYLGYRGTFEEARTQSSTINSEVASISFQDVQVLGSDGELTWMQPHILGCMVAGLQAGSDVGTPATFKYIAANGIRHVKKQGVTPSSSELFNPDLVGNKNQAIDDGLLIVDTPSSGGVRVVLHNTTYQNDANFCFNRVHVLYAANYVAFNLRQQLETIFVGDTAKTGTAESIRNAVIAIMDQFLQANIIVGDDTNDNLGWKNLTVTVTGNVASIDITITPVQGIDFILAKITLDNIRQTA